MGAFYPCLSCDTVEKSIQTFFCNSCESNLSHKVKQKMVNIVLCKERSSMKIETPYPTKRSYISKLWYRYKDILIPIIVGLTPMIIILGMIIYASK